MKWCVGWCELGIWCGARVDAPFGGGWWGACGGGGLISGGVGALAEYGALFLDKKLSLKSIGKSYIPCV